MGKFAFAFPCSGKQTGIKNPLEKRVSSIYSASPDQLLNFGFLVHHVLANHWIVLFHLHFFRSVFLILIRGVEVAGTFGRYHADFISC